MSDGLTTHRAIPLEAEPALRVRPGKTEPRKDFIAWRLAVLACVLCLGACSPGATPPRSVYSDERRALRRVKWLLDEYVYAHGVWPTTDEAGTWLEKMQPDILRRFPGIPVHWDLPAPTDFAYVPPSAENGHQLVLRLVGPNGVDDGGALDDYDWLKGANFGYWETRAWPRLYGQAAGALVALCLLALLVTLRRRWSVRTVARMILVTGCLAAFFVPWGSQRGRIDPFSIPVDPPWIRDTITAGYIAIGLGSVMHLVPPLPRRRIDRYLRRRFGQCRHCGYDIRMELAASRDICPECGQYVRLRL